MKPDPQIIFNKVLCPVCMEPTGCQTNCHLTDQAKKVPRHQRKIIYDQTILPILLPQCHFRQTNTWTADTNYAVSITMIQMLSDIEGLNSVTPTKPYQFEFIISPLHKELDVKREIVRRYSNFVKTANATRSTVDFFMDGGGIPAPSGV